MRYGQDKQAGSRGLLVTGRVGQIVTALLDILFIPEHSILIGTRVNLFRMRHRPN